MAVLSIDMFVIALIFISVILIGVGTYFIADFEDNRNSQEYQTYSTMVMVSVIVILLSMFRLSWLFNNVDCMNISS